MRIKVLGCSGGIGGDLRTTSMLVDDDILIDAGTGVGDLSIEQLAKIDHIFITHAHLDHVTSIPFMVDTVCWMRDKPVTVHSTAATLQVLKDHLFNWKIWPDFSQIPDSDKPFMVYSELTVGSTVDLGGRKFTAVPANHVVPAVGYLVDSGKASFLFSGDTTVNDALWEVANATANLKYLVVETAFSNKERSIAVASKHLCPSMLASELSKLKRPVEVFVTHLKPGEVQLTMSEIEKEAAKWKPRMLENGHEFQL
ncbi:MAG TPA: 3',5'-cyclic-nucleotide phosphodiesterase [Usitatibacteraceae bacterium]